MKNLRVLIVEDEIAIANLIKGLIDCERLNLICTGIALDGCQAYEIIQRDKPDIVITDIRMPFLTGLELIEKVQSDESLQLSPHFIIISGMTSFEYALSAIKMGIDGYLLKPINKDELNNVLEKSIMKIGSERQIDYQIQKNIQDSHLYMQKLRRSFIMDILYAKFSRKIPVDQLNKEYGFSFSQDSAFSMGVVQIDGIASQNLPTQTAIVEQMMRMFQTDIKKHCIDAEVYAKNNQFIYLINYDPQSQPLVAGTMSAIHEGLANYLASYEGVCIALGCGIPVASTDALNYSLQTSYQALRARILLGSSRVLSAQSLLSKKIKPTFILTESAKSALMSKIELQDRQQVRLLLIQIFKEAAQGSRSCPHLLLDLYRSTLSELLAVLQQHHFISRNPTEVYIQYGDAIEQFFSLKPLVQYTVSFIIKLLPFHEQEDNQEDKLFQTARQYMQQHFAENLRLEDVAAQFYLTPSYFGTLFKKKTGDSFRSYLTTIRMEKAKELLQDARYSVAQVAGAVGYQDKRYFSRLFKEQVGVTPKEYRKIYLI